MSIDVMTMDVNDLPDLELKNLHRCFRLFCPIDSSLLVIGAVWVSWLAIIWMVRGSTA